MGASSELLDAAYETHKVYQRKAFQSPEPITTENFADHLGDKKYYQSYLKFFSDELLTKGTSKTLETYLYSKQANFADEEGQKSPLMFARFIGGVFHPLIHVGYGLEFGLPGMVAEGEFYCVISEMKAAKLEYRSFPKCC
jgi:Questin oxidase-like